MAHPLFGRRVMKKSKQAQDELGNITAAAQENASQREIRSYGMQEQQVNLFLGLIQRFFKINLRTVKYRHFLVPVLEMVTALGLGVLLVRGMKWASPKEFTLGCRPVHVLRPSQTAGRDAHQFEERLCLPGAHQLPPERTGYHAGGR
ncbi:MAG: hypothetical protein ACLRPT_05230 [Akkermansia muciniphila]